MAAAAEATLPRPKRGDFAVDMVAKSDYFCNDSKLIVELDSAVPASG